MFALKIYDVSGKCLSKLTQSPPDVGRKMNMSARYLVIVFFSLQRRKEMRASGLISSTRSVAEWLTTRAATGLWSRTLGRSTVCDLRFFFSYSFYLFLHSFSVFFPPVLMRNLKKVLRQINVAWNPRSSP